MLFIPCTDNCLYQSDGMCTLDHCTVPGHPDQSHPCVHYVPVLSPSPAAAKPVQYCGPEKASDEKDP